MPLYSVSLLFSLEVQAPDAPPPLQELAVHVLAADDEQAAEARGRAIGKGRETSYDNAHGEAVCDVFKAVVEVQQLIDDQLRDGMEVASWMFRKGEVLVVGERGSSAELPRSSCACGGHLVTGRASAIPRRGL